MLIKKIFCKLYMRPLMPSFNIDHLSKLIMIFSLCCKFYMRSLMPSFNIDHLSNRERWVKLHQVSLELASSQHFKLWIIRAPNLKSSVIKPTITTATKTTNKCSNKSKNALNNKSNKPHELNNNNNYNSNYNNQQMQQQKKT